MGRKCSHCGNIGHNSRTCNASKVVQDNNNNNIGGAAGGGVMKLFGVHIYISSSSSSSSSSNSTTNSCGADNPMKKSLSLDCLSSSSSSSSRLAINDNSSLDMTASFGSLSDAPPERKKGVPWTEEEHRSFLIGLEIVGKGDWRGISRNYVPTRTPTQVASHAQKYFLRLSTLAADKKRRRSSLFDMVGAEPSKP